MPCRNWSAPPTTEGHALLLKGRELLGEKETEKAEEVLFKAIDTSKQEGTTDIEADARTLLGGTYMRQEKWDEAETQFAAELKLHQETEEPEEQAGDYTMLYMVAMGRKDLEKAEEALNELEEIARKIGSKHLGGNAALLRAQLWEQRDDKQRAIECCESALRLYAEDEDTSSGEVGRHYLATLRGEAPAAS